YRMGQALFGFGMLWFLAAMAPTHSFVPVMDPLSERNFYSALPGFLLMAWSPVSRRAPRSMQGVLLGAYLFFAWFAGSDRVAMWKDPVLLWTDAAVKAPGKTRSIHNAAVALRERGRDAEAFRFLIGGVWGAHNQEELRSVLALLAQTGWEASGRNWKKFREEILPQIPKDYWRHFVHLTAALQQRNGPEFDHAWKNAPPLTPLPKDPLWSDSLRRVLKARQRVDTGRPQEAVDLLLTVFRRFPADLQPYWHDWYTIARAWRALGRQEEEVRYLQRFVDRSWFFKQIPPQPLRRLAELREARGEWRSAADCWGSLIRTNVDDPKLRERYAEALRRAGLRGHVPQQEQADFFKRRIIPRDDPREWVRR
ncbi:MAG: hypothetical protein HUU37_04675, partial [Bdellovibrionales bacterium]|nr:hypothetical protein [Bdellovibrionales bacterium]